MSIQLQHYREQIDDLDNKILDLVAQRFQIVREVGALKTAQNIKIVQTQRVQEVLDRVSAMAHDNNIPTSLIYDLYMSMIEQAHQIETEIKETHKTSQ